MLDTLDLKVPVVAFERAWPALEPAVERWGEHTKHSVWWALQRGDVELWTTPKSAAVSEMVEYPSGLRIVRGWLAGGVLKDVEEQFVPQMIEWGKQRGATQFRILARPGFGRVLGLRELGRVYTRDI